MQPLTSDDPPPSTPAPAHPSPSFSPYTPRPTRSCILPPTLIHICDPDSSPPSPPSLLQFSLHSTPPSLRRDLRLILPSLPAHPPHPPPLILSTFQPTFTPLTTFTDSTERAKALHLELFTGFARSLALLLTGRGFYADYIDPCTGQAGMGVTGGTVYSEVEGASQLLGYRVEQAGFCSIVLHPQWGSACYPASLVTNADVGSVMREMDKVRRRWEVKGGGEREQKVDDGGQGGEASGARGGRREGGEVSSEAKEKEGAKEGEEVKAFDVASASTSAEGGSEEAKVIQRREGRREDVGSSQRDDVVGLVQQLTLR